MKGTGCVANGGASRNGMEFASFKTLSLIRQPALAAITSKIGESVLLLVGLARDSLIFNPSRLYC